MFSCPVSLVSNQPISCFNIALNRDMRSFYKCRCNFYTTYILYFTITHIQLIDIINEIIEFCNAVNELISNELISILLISSD